MKHYFKTRRGGGQEEGEGDLQIKCVSAFGHGLY